MCAVAGALAGLGAQTWLLQVGGAALEFLVQARCLVTGTST